MTLQQLLGIPLPIIQAPMAGVQGSALTVAVCNAGGLGSLPCATLGLDAMRQELVVIRAQTTQPFNVNFFCHTPPTPNDEREAVWRSALAPFFAELGIDAMIASALGGLIGDAKISALVFVLSIAVLNLGVRLVLPDDQTLLLLSIILIPLAPVFGVHPWVVVITLLATFTLWLLPTQTASYAVAYEASEGRLFTHLQARKACLGFIAVTLLGLVAVFPYWRWLKLITP